MNKLCNICNMVVKEMVQDGKANSNISDYTIKL